MDQGSYRRLEDIVSICPSAQPLPKQGMGPPFLKNIFNAISYLLVKWPVFGDINGDTSGSSR
jgi:hypothetical protein